MRKLSLFLIISLLQIPAIAFSQTRVTSEKARTEIGIERYLNIRAAGSPALSPNSDRIAFLTNITGTPQVWMVSAQGGWPDQLTFFNDRVDFVQWSPDGSGLLFAKSRGGDENAQLFWLSPDGSEVRALTDAPKIRHNFGRFSHDGKMISYSSNKRNPNYFDIYVMDLSSGVERMVYQQDGSNAAGAWSFDNQKIIVSRQNEELSLDNDLFLVDIASGKATHLTPHKGSAQFGDAHFSRDGRFIILGTNKDREFYSLARLNVESKAIEIVDDTNWDLDAAALSEDGSLLAYTINREGYRDLFLREVRPDGSFGPGRVPVKLPAIGIAGGLEISKDNRKLAFTFSGSSRTGDIWIYEIGSGRLQQVTRSSLAGIPQASFVEPELIRYKTFDNRDIPAWIYKPAISPGSKMPVIVNVHGGPEAQAQPGFSPIFQYFLSRGYAVLAPNVRGSTGYGKTYTHLDDVQKREDSVKDLAAAVDWLKANAGVDANRIAVMGGSYGGYMTLAAITLYPDLWAAAVNTVGIANFESFLKNTSGYRRKLREREYGSLERDLEFLRSISPIYKVDRIKAPLMVIHGKNDPRVPYTEAEQIVEALRKRNVPVEYKLFDDEGHGIAKLSNRLIVYPLMVEFLDRHIGGQR